MWKTFCHSAGANSIKTNLQTCKLWTGQYVSYKSVNQFCPTRIANRFSHLMLKTFHICKWMSFTILNFVIVEEKPSGLYYKYFTYSRAPALMTSFVQSSTQKKYNISRAEAVWRKGTFQYQSTKQVNSKVRFI